MTTRSSHGSGNWIAGGMERMIGRATNITGPARSRVVILLACVIGLGGADKGALGAVAPQLELALHIDNIQIGLLVTVSSLGGAAASLPLGVLADRASRKRVLIATILIWSAAMVASGLAVDYLMLLVARLALGAVTGAAGPCVASLIGDLFYPEERGRIYGYILTGELLGAGFGIQRVGSRLSHHVAPAGGQWGHAYPRQALLSGRHRHRRGFRRWEPRGARQYVEVRDHA